MTAALTTLKATSNIVNNPGKNVKESKNKPNFLIIGAPRCGTTTLYEMLRHHPQIFMSAVKEPHYFASLDFPYPENEILKITTNLDEYEKLFRDAGDKIAGEASSYYLADPAAAARIYEYNPQMKLIVILRNPVDRAYSHYLLYNRRGKQQETFYEKVTHQECDKGPLVYDIVELGKYSSQLERYKKYFSDNQLLVLSFEEFTKQPVQTLTKILQYLEVDTDFAAALAGYKAENTHQVPRNAVVEKVLSNEQLMKLGLKLVPRDVLSYVRTNILLKKANKEQIDERAVEVLKEIYQPELKHLAHYNMN